MADSTRCLHLTLPLGSRYWNLDTWVKNMEVLDKAYKDTEKIIIDRLQASNVDCKPNTNVQDKIDELSTLGSWTQFIDVTSNMNIIINPSSHCYLTLAFGPTVYNVTFSNRVGRNFEWINDYPNFEPNSVYELSFLDLACIWAKRNDFDWSRFFGYHIDNGICYVNYVKIDDWVGYFHNGDVTVPNYIEGCPVQIELITGW